jgi:hypothetical protein
VDLQRCLPPIARLQLASGGGSNTTTKQVTKAWVPHGSHPGERISYTFFTFALPNRYGKFTGPSTSIPPSKNLDRAADCGARRRRRTR